MNASDNPHNLRLADIEDGKKYFLFVEGVSHDEVKQLSNYIAENMPALGIDAKIVIIYNAKGKVFPVCDKCFSSVGFLNSA